jgi:hypothetical protein
MRQTAENSLTLDVCELARAGALRPGITGSITWFIGNRECASIAYAAERDGLRLSYRWGARPEPFVYLVPLTRTPVHFGGERVWFSCPKCEKRVQKLYLPPGENTFLCRTCHRLAYACHSRSAVVRWQGIWAKYAQVMAAVEEPMVESRRLRRLAYQRAKLAAALKKIDLSSDHPPILAPGPVAPEGAEADIPPTRPRGRPPIPKRAYVRTRPFLTSERKEPTEHLCMRCRDFREMKEPQPLTLRNGRPAMRGNCPVCGATMVAIVTAGKAG